MTTTGKLIPTVQLEKLKCSKCWLYLSVPPIVPLNNGFICGRCVSKTMSVLPHSNTIYETVAQLLTFPCIYNTAGCKQELTWGSVLKHEASCPHKLYNCPSTPLGQCTWKGQSEQFITHFDTCHKELTMNWTYFYLPIKHTEHVNKLMSYKDHLFIFQTYTNVDLGKCWLGLRRIGKLLNSTELFYDIRFKCTENTNEVSLTRKKINDDASWNYDKAYMEQVDIKQIKSMLNSTNVLCKLELIEMEESTESSSQNKSDKKGVTPDAELLEELECPICSNYMISPIYICQGGHSICKECKQKIAKCGFCESPIGTTRNFTLEKLSGLVKYPCRNVNDGCSFIGDSTNIREHEASCSLLKVSCPLKRHTKCSWKGEESSVSGHVRVGHMGCSWISLKAYMCRNLNSTVYEDFHLIEHDNQLFKLCLKHSSPNDLVYLCVQQIKLKEGDAPKYKYVVEFLDQTDVGRQFVVDGLCYGDNEDDFLKCLAVPSNLLEPFFDKEHCLMYTLDILSIR